MKLFLSWSGERSKQVGKVFSEILPCIIQSCEPFFSQDIDKGTQWLTQITKELDESHVGIICLTQENLNEPWLLFEAGALSKSLEHAHVCTFLLDIEPTDVRDPIAQFQATKNSKEDIFMLIRTINSCSEENARLNDAVLERTFEQFWPDLEKKLGDIPALDNLPPSPKRDDRELLEEVLEILRSEKYKSLESVSDVTHYLGGSFINLIIHVKDKVNQKVIGKEMFHLLGKRIEMIGYSHNKIILYLRKKPTVRMIHQISSIKGVKNIEWDDDELTKMETLDEHHTIDDY